MTSTSFTDAFPMGFRDHAEAYNRDSIVVMFSRCLAVFLVIAGATGCGSTIEMPSTVPVTGLVEVDGQPVEGARVLFIPLEKTANSCMGTTDSSGKYELTQASFRGATPGKYKVTVELYKQSDGKPIPEELKNDAMQLVAMGRAKQILPRKYADPAATELNGEVGNEPTTLDFILKSK